MTDRPVAIITAAGKGMGAACARELAGQGWRLSLLSPSKNCTELAKELSALAVLGSVTRTEDLEQLVKRTLADYGRIDAVINNTGHPPKGDLLAIPDDDWRAGCDMVFLNVVRLARLVTPIMEKQRAGSIVNISSLGAVQPSRKYPVSSCFRAGLAAFTKMFADQYASAGIRMNNVLPGFIDTYPVDADVVRDIPLKRAGTAEEVAKVAAFLASAASSYVTGQNIRVDGGYTRAL
jgi:NAD(P)-dependent dehydrogenase (short-subunit alcohol dehydrogenase family)